MGQENSKYAGIRLAPDMVRSEVPYARSSSLPMFSARCEVRDTSSSSKNVQNLRLSISQRLRTHNVEQSWDTVIVQCGEESDGTLTVKVIISNPDWDEPLQIANLRSRPSDLNSLTALGCNLDHKSIA